VTLAYWFSVECQIYVIYIMSRTTATVWIWIIPKGSCVKGLAPSLMLRGSGGTLKRWGLVRGLRSLGQSFKGDFERLVSSCPSLSLSGCEASASCTMCSHPHALPCHRLNSNVPTNFGPHPPKY
jgi:hypothetical protein